jgi:hypothetical protein
MLFRSSTNKKQLTMVSIWLALATLLKFRQLSSITFWANMKDFQDPPLAAPRTMDKQLSIHPTTKQHYNKSITGNFSYFIADASTTIDQLKRQWKLVQGQPSETLRLPFSIPRRRRNVDQDAITVAVHADTEKLNRLLFLIQRWQGPVSASIYIHSPQHIERLVHFVWNHAEELAWVDFHLLMEDNDLGYPHNLLRDMALKSIDSDYFLALDVDFVTTPNAYQGIQTLIRSEERVRTVLRNRTFLVLPAFERVFEDGRHIDEDQVLNLEPGILPRNRSEAIQMWSDGQLDPFHMKKVQWGHGPSQFPKWRQGENAFNASSFYPIRYDMGFEPYVVGYYDRDLPRYWPAFRGFGFNKYTWFVEAHFKGWKFSVLWDFFVVHLNHPYATRNAKQDTKTELRRFKKYLKKMGYNVTKEEYDDI